MINKHPLVSVAVITYGHENYILDTLKGILSQTYSGDLEIILSNDNSPDNTDDVITSFLKENPLPSHITIRYTKHATNKGAIPNFIWTIRQCTGQYIALCEGDDYWTDPLKLQKQVDFLEAHPDHVLCFHKVNILQPNGELVDDFITNVPENYELRETLATNNNYIHTPSVLFRNIAAEEYNILEFKNSPIGDYFLYLILTQYGKIGFIPDTMAVYRYGVGVYSSAKEYQQLRDNLYLFINLYSFEKDEKIKKIWYEKIKSISDKTFYNLNHAQTILGTRRHKVVEKIHRWFKK